MKMVQVEDTVDFDDEVIATWVGDTDKAENCAVILTGNEVVIVLNEFPQYHPLTGEKISFPEPDEE